MTFDPNDPRLHDGSWTAKRPAHLPLQAVSPIEQAHAAADRRWREILDARALSGGGSPLLWAPDELARHVEAQLRVMGCNGWTGNTVDWAAVIAFSLAGWASAARAEEARVDTGDAA